MFHCKHFSFASIISLEFMWHIIKDSFQIKVVFTTNKTLLVPILKFYLHSQSPLLPQVPFISHSLLICHGWSWNATKKLKLGFRDNLIYAAKTINTTQQFTEWIQKEQVKNHEGTNCNSKVQILTLSDWAWCELVWVYSIKINWIFPSFSESWLNVCHCHSMGPGWPHYPKEISLTKGITTIIEVLSTREVCQFFLNCAYGVESNACTIWLVWGGIAITCILFSFISSKKGML